MRINCDAVWTAITTALQTGQPVSEKMLRVINVCEASFPHADWMALKPSASTAETILM